MSILGSLPPSRGANVLANPDEPLNEDADARSASLRPCGPSSLTWFCRCKVAGGTPTRLCCAWAGWQTVGMRMPDAPMLERILA
jgi:hypothetical protein